MRATEVVIGAPEFEMDFEFRGELSGGPRAPGKGGECMPSGQIEPLDEGRVDGAGEAQILERGLQVGELAELHPAFNPDRLPAAIRFLDLSVKQRERHLPGRFPRCRVSEPGSEVRRQRVKIQIETVTGTDRYAAGGQNLPDRVHPSMCHGLGPRPQLDGGDEFVLGSNATQIHRSWVLSRNEGYNSSN